MPPGSLLLSAAGALGCVAGLLALAASGRSGSPQAPARPADEVRTAALAGLETRAGIETRLAARAARAAAARPAADPLLVATGDDEDAPRRRGADRSGWTERELRTDFVRRGRADAAALEAEARRVLGGEGRDVEKVAVLLALRDLRSACASELFVAAIRGLPDAPRRAGESVPSTALVQLDRLAARDAWARTALAEVAFGQRDRPAAPLRARAAASYCLHAAPDELRAAAVDLARETDEIVRAAALEALSRNPNPDAAGPLLAANPRPDRPALHGVGGHP